MACSEKRRRAGRSIGGWNRSGRILVGCGGRKGDGLGECAAPSVAEGAAARRRRRWRSREGMFIVGFGSGGQAGWWWIWRSERMMRMTCVGGGSGELGIAITTAARRPEVRPAMSALAGGKMGMGISPATKPKRRRVVGMAIASVDAGTRGF